MNTDADEARRLAPYVPRLSIDWLRTPELGDHQSIDGTVAFVDVSGFTALTERLASRGKEGAEEVSDLIGDVFTELLDTGYEYGCELLKWGGDAALVLFREPASAARAARAAWLMSRAMSRLGQVRTSAGRVRLSVSIGLHRGRFDLYLLGEEHKELVVTGPAASATARMEAVAESGEVVVSRATAAELDGATLGAEKGDGILLRRAPEAEPRPSRTPVDVGDVDVARLLPPPTRVQLLGGGEAAEHRHAAVAFVEFTGVDALRAAEGPGAVAEALGPVIVGTQEAAARHGVTFHGTDISPDGGKILVLGGVPVVRGNDGERVLRAVRDVVTATSVLGLRAGVNAGRVFMHETGPPYRRIHSFSGDAVNLAARVMGRAEAGQVLATRAVLERSRSRFATTALEPFSVKGKSEPVEAFEVGPLVTSRAEEDPGALGFVGRGAELAALLEAAGRATSGTGAVVDIVAEPGMGKSRLVAEAIGRAGLQTFVVACEGLGEEVPYSAMRQLLLDVLGLPDDAGPEMIGVWLSHTVADRVPELAPWLPLLADVLDVPAEPTAEVRQLAPRFRQRRLAESVLALLTCLVDRPSALVFEDLHDIDEASWTVIGQLATGCAGRPWLLLLTRRPMEWDPVPAGAVGVVRLVLGALGTEAADELLGLAAAERPLRPAERDQLVARAAGNPLFLRELVRAFREVGSVDELPDTIEPLLAAQVDRLAPADRQVLRAAAVLGVHFDTDLLAHLLDEGDALDAARWRRLDEFVVADTAGARRFAHALMRDAAYEGLSFRRRRDLHGRAAEAIEHQAERPEDQAELLSLHYAAAERHEPAWRFSRLAGERSTARYANTDAARFFARALEAGRRLKDVAPSETAAVAEALGDASELDGDYDVAGRAYAEARRLHPAPVDRARLLRKTGVIHERHGHYKEALRCYTRGRALVDGGRGAAGRERAELAVAYAGVRYRQGRYRDCLAWAERAAKEAGRARHRSGLAHALYIQDIALSDMALSADMEAGASEAALRALAIFEELDDLVGQGNVLNNLGIGAYYLGRWSDALAYYRRSGEARERAGDVIGAATEDNNIAEVLSDQGHFDEARALFESALATWQSTNYPVGAALALANLGRLAARSGQPEEATRRLAEAHERFSSIGAAAYVLETEIRQAEQLLLAGDGAAALVAAEAVGAKLSSLEGAELLNLPVRRILGLAHHATGGDAGALEVLDEAVTRAQSVQALFELAQSLAAHAVVGAAARGPDGDTGSRADARTACDLFERLGVERAVISSCDDAWPQGPLARALSGRGR
ncbi:MAG TPA: adenylate/guanylate cyclase domain-containing protein [Acidimicrobiales bacterium]|nr:adenylate/guanylate cyclase domain-containing protein [Acidimicrobiales bacterium]